MPAASPRLSIIILTWNQRDYTLRCLQSISSLVNDEAVEVLLVDNASTDGTREAVARDFPSVKVIVNSENRGVAAARNQGLKQATGRKLMLLDNDTIASADAITAIEHYLDTHPAVGLCGCRLVGEDGTVQASYKEYPGLGIKVRNVLGMKRKEATFPVDDEGNLTPTYVIGACQMFPRKVLERVGLLDEHIFYGPEDADYCLRVAAAGWQVKYLTQPTIVHCFQRSTTRRIFSPLGRKHIAALLYFYRKHRRLW